jgi:hypothetical protein
VRQFSGTVRRKHPKFDGRELHRFRELPQPDGRRSFCGTPRRERFERISLPNRARLGTIAKKTAQVNETPHPRLERGLRQMARAAHRRRKRFDSFGRDGRMA